MGKKWVVFKNKLTGRDLLRLSLEGLYLEEINETKELLAYENGLNKTDITIKTI